MRAPVFYTLCLLAAVAMTVLAASPVFDRPGAAVEGNQGPGQSVQFSGPSLEQIAGGADVAVTPPPGISGALTGVAVAALSPFEPASSKGARLLIAPETRARLAGSAQRLNVTFEPLPEPDSLPPAINAGFVVAGAPIQWVSARVSTVAGRQTVSLILARPAEPPLALALAPSIDPEGKSNGPGFQVHDLELTPVQPAPIP
jgi:hypothetical protein